MPDNPLKGKWIAITRPIKQAKSFTQIIQKVGGCPLSFPLIEISPIDNEVTREQLRKLTDYDILIFVSSNAVKYCLKHISTHLLKHKTLVTTGKKTAQTLIDQNLSVRFSPEKIFNSEALLAIDAFRNEAANKNIAIIRGSNGRDYLKDHLITLGASVDYIDVYSRHCPQHNLDNLKNSWKNGKLDTVLLTSASSTAQFFELATEDWINNITILIGSQRMKSNIPAHFRGKIIVAEDPSDETIFATLSAELQ